jgi:hypothetical protein
MPRSWKLFLFIAGLAAIVVGVIGWGSDVVKAIFSYSPGILLGASRVWTIAIAAFFFVLSVLGFVAALILGLRELKKGRQI